MNKIVSKERSRGVDKPAHSGRWWRVRSPISMIHWDSSPTIFPFKNCHEWAEALELVSGHESTISPDCCLFWLKYHSFLLTLASRITGLWVVSSQTWVQLHFYFKRNLLTEKQNKTAHPKGCEFSFIWGLTEDYSQGDSLSDSLEELFQRGKEGGQHRCDFGEGVRAIKHTPW